MIVIPAVDVLDRRVVRLHQGDYGSVSSYGDDPVAVARTFHDDGASLVHVVDLEAARGGERSLDVLSELGKTGVAFQLGGGIRSAANAVEAISLGASRVVVGSVIVSDPTSASGIVNAVGAEAVVAAIDVRDGMARGAGWLDDGIPLGDALGIVCSLGIGTALVTGIERDGTMEGPALGLLAEVRGLVPDLALIASGGVGSIADIRALAKSELSFEGVIVGRALYEGRFTLPEAIEVAG